jgi:ubiquinone/menaquinone biosynthesis C-methylase UbiE
MIRDLPRKPRIIDIGCGPGMQTVELAKLSKGSIEVVDNHQPFLDQLRKKSSVEGVGDTLKQSKVTFSLRFILAAALT